MPRRTSRQSLALRVVRRFVRMAWWWAQQLRVVPRERTSPAHARWSLLSLDAPAGLGFGWRVWRRLTPRSFAVDLRLGNIYFSRETIDSDRATYGEIFVAQEYKADYSGAHVIDVGAHKGYFGAYALVHGAASVTSYEPEERNFASLERAADSFRRSGCKWKTVRAAVGSRDGDVDLKISKDSWTHSTVDLPDAEPRHSSASQRVRMVPMRSILEDIAKSPGRAIVKVDAEGAECDIILSTAPGGWKNVVDVFLEFHATAPCSLSDVMDHLEQAEFGRVPGVGGVVRFRRTARSDVVV